MQPTMSDPWIPTAFTATDEFKEFAIDMADKYPQAFRLLPVGAMPEHPHAAWANYDFDGVVSLWIDTSHDESIQFYRNNFKKQKENTMSRALTIHEDKQVKGLLAANINAIRSVLPKHLPPEKMARMAYTAIVKTPDLARCSQLSLFNAVLEAASIGLEIGGPLGHAHLIPFKGKATLIVDYKGLIELAYKSPRVKSFSAHPVYEHDEFDYWYGLNRDLRHRPASGAKGKLTHAYAIVEFTGGGFDFEVVNREDAMAAKENSPAKNKPDSPWNVPKHEWTMWLKTAVRKLMKRIPKSAELQRALDQDESGSVRDDNFIDVDFSTMNELKGKTVTGDAVDVDTGQPTEQQEQSEPEQRQAQPTPHSEEDMKVLANLDACRDDSALAEIYMQACANMKIDPNAEHTPATARKIFEEMEKL